MREQGEVVVRSGGFGAHTETWYAGTHWRVILGESASGNSLSAVCLRCFSSPPAAVQVTTTQCEVAQRTGKRQVLYNVQTIVNLSDELTPSLQKVLYFKGRYVKTC